MKKTSRPPERNDEIVTFFYMIMSHRIREGMNPDEARRVAYDAVALRYEISDRYLLNIISKQKVSRRAKTEELRKNAIDLIGHLQAANGGLDEAKAKNERLISLLKECLEDDR